MQLKQILFVAFLTIIAVCVLGNDPYKVTTPKLNIRKAPTTASKVIGSLTTDDIIDVISISKGWALIRTNNRTGYVSTKYIIPVSKSETIAEEPVVFPEEEIEEYPADNSPRNVVQKEYNPLTEDLVTPLEIGSFVPASKNLYLAGRLGVGWSNFIWNGGRVNGTIAFEVDVLAQLYFESKASFIPKNWYWELGVGYKKVGAAKFDMSYIHLDLVPFGYRIPLNPINITPKIGLDFSFPLGSLKTSNSSWNTNVEFGLICGVDVEWRQFGIGLNFLYDFNEVSSSCGQTLNNIGILGIITYKFGKLGHKK